MRQQPTSDLPRAWARRDLMKYLFGGASALCDGLNRREISRAGGPSLFGLRMPKLLRAAQQNRGK